MNEKELLKAMSEIKDEYIIEAAADAEASFPDAEKRAKARFSWKSYALAAAAVFALCIGIGSLGHVGSRNFASDSASAETESYNYSMGSNGYGINDMSSKYADAPSASEAYDGASFDEYYEEPQLSARAEKMKADPYKAETKLIRRANITIQTTEFAEAEQALTQLVKKLGGYFESSDVSNGGYYSGSSLKNGYYTIRIPADKYSEFIDSAGEGCHISNISESTTDIGEEYFDTETRLNTLRTKLDRLTELLSKAGDLTDIIALENEISDTEYQIDLYTSTLNRYDSLVNYASIYIELDEVSRVDDGITQDNSFLAQLGRSLKNGILRFVDGLGDLINWAAFNLIGIAIIVAVIVILKKNHVFGRAWSRLKKNKKKSDE